MAPMNTFNTVRFPVKLLSITLIVLMVLSAGLIWNGYTIEQLTLRIREEFVRNQELRDTIIYFDEVLTMSSRLAILTDDPRWKERYDEVLPQLFAIIEEAQALAPESAKAALAQTDSANERLAELEEQAFALKSAGREEEARDLLFSTEYEEQKQIYLTGMNAFLAALETELDQALLEEEANGLISIIVALVALVVSLVTWLALVHNLETWRRVLDHEISERTQAVSEYLALVQQVALGNLNQQIEVPYSGALGELGQGLNHMAESLNKAHAEAIRLQEAEMQGRQQLEQAVAEYLAFVQQVAEGNLRQRLNVQDNGKLGQLGVGLNQMVERLHIITTHVQNASTDITAAAEDILSATTQQTMSATQQSSALSETSTTIEEIKAVVERTAEQSGLLAQDSQATLQMVQQGTQTVERMVNGMEQIRQQVEGIAHTILNLSDQTKAIGVITTTVSELADRSNLLALNAAIEAARAGEQGKSFAVVAQHVRDLAERSKLATLQVQEILTEIQKATTAAVMVTEEGTKGVETGTRDAQQTGHVIHQIKAEVENGAQANVQMAQSNQQATSGIGQISQALHTMQFATKQALISTQETEVAAQNLHTLAQTLQHAIAAYRL